MKRKFAALLVAIVCLAPASRSQKTSIVEYDIDGTTKYVDVTWNLMKGSTEQKRLKLPVHESFQATSGTFAYVSAQKVTVYGDIPLGLSRPEVLGDGSKGTVHVVIHINWRKVGEATADAPYGIAKASASVE